jgi:hypothetical protein
MPCTATHAPGTLCFACRRARLAGRPGQENRPNGVPIEAPARSPFGRRLTGERLTDRQQAHRRAMLAHLQRAR